MTKCQEFAKKPQERFLKQNILKSGETKTKFLSCDAKLYIQKIAMLSF